MTGNSPWANENIYLRQRIRELEEHFHDPTTGLATHGHNPEYFAQRDRIATLEAALREIADGPSLLSREALLEGNYSGEYDEAKSIALRALGEESK